MRTFKHAMGDEVVVKGVVGKIVGRCEYSEEYDPTAPLAHGNYYCVRIQVSGNFDWSWYAEAEVQG